MKAKMAAAAAAAAARSCLRCNMRHLHADGSLAEMDRDCKFAVAIRIRHARWCILKRRHSSHSHTPGCRGMGLGKYCRASELLFLCRL